MSEFRKYQHIERYGTSETEGLTEGVVYAFYKIDGTNGSIWWDEDRMRFGSRNRELDIENDNAGFMNANIKNENLILFFRAHPTIRLFGEWLVPHSLKTYNDNAWGKFYVFEAMEDGTEGAVPYDVYKEWLDAYNIEYIPPLCIFKNPTNDMILQAVEKSGQYLVKDGGGVGEGIVLKNYEYYNKHGRQTWGKVITNEFKDRHHKEMGAPIVIGSKIIEEEIVFDFLTEHFILKEKAKIEVESGEWTSKMIPQLLGVVFHELITEEIWNIMKKYKNPKIDFSLLNRLVIAKTKKTIGL